jgi:hypothetical protein
MPTFKIFFDESKNFHTFASGLTDTVKLEKRESRVRIRVSRLTKGKGKNKGKN